MADGKKSYLNNPALQFISSSLVEDVQKETDEAPPVRKEAAPRPQRTPKPKPEKSKPARPIPKTPQTTPQVSPHAVPLSKEDGEAVPMKPIYIEVRSKRVNALLQPSLYKKLLAISKTNGVSVNETIHRALEQFVSDK